ncbi:MAG: hypothetical protein NUV82_04695 [Candidatus Komeilibacteria bacterium]|nr:hypothetical protein [Candidatus Komeilibacteria bacterium]
MNVEKPKTIERQGKNRERLLSLEKEGRYVFHGSPDDIAVLQPRQAYNRSEKTGIIEKDGDPAVFATPYADIAIFRALINTKAVTEASTSQFGMDNDRLFFSATNNLLEAARAKIGKVYVLDRRKFHNFEGMQCRSEEINEPIEVIEVNVDDLPKNIEKI